MIFKKLTINNFMAIGHAEIALDNQGLVLIQGENDDDSSATSNGAGKSSVVDALCWALFGVTARKESGDRVVNRTHGKDCEVRVIIEDGSEQYEVVRYRKHSVHKNRIDLFHGAVSLTKGTDKETQALIEQILGCTYDVFAASIYAGQESMVDLPSLTDKMLKELIEEAAGITRLQAAYEIARKRSNDAEKERVHIGIDAKTLEGIREMLTANVTDSTARSVAWGAANAKSVAEQEDIIHRLRADLQDQKRVVESFPLNLMARRREVADSFGEHEAEKKTLKALEEKVSDCKRAAALFEAELGRIEKQVRKEKAAYENIDEELKRPCPECGKPHTEEERDELRKHIGARLKSAVTDFKAGREKMKAFEDVVEKAKKDVTDYQSTMTDVWKASEELSAIDRVIAEKVAAEKELDNMEKRLVELLFRLSETKIAPNPHSDQIKKFTEELRSTNEKIKEAEENMNAAVQKVELADLAVKVFGPAGVRAHILDTVTPYLNARTAEYLNHLSDGNLTAVWSTLTKTAKGDLREKFNIEVSNTTGADTFSGLSGGEKRKVRLACSLALQDLVASRAAKPIELFVGDEIDHALDPAGLERLMGVLENKAKDRGTVLVISHSDLTDWVKDVMVVTKKGGHSVVSGSLVIS